MKKSIIELLENKFKADVTLDRERFNNSIEVRLVDNGYKVERDRKHSFLANAQINFLVSSPDGELCAIEVDNKTPRGRSLDKINKAQENGVSGFILLRNPNLSQSYKSCGVDIVIARRIR